MLTPGVAAEFGAPTVPAGWSVTPWNPGGTATVAGGLVTVDGARASLDALVALEQSLEFVATFSGDPYQHVGFGITFNETPWAMFSTASGGGALRQNQRRRQLGVDTVIPGSWLGAPHHFRIDWTATSITYWIDGTQVATHAAVISGTVRPIVSDYNLGGGGVSVDWVHVTPYASSGTFTSRVPRRWGKRYSWNQANWTSSVPAGTTLSLSARFGNTPVPDATWTSFAGLASSGTALAQSSRYVQYQATFAGTGAATPILQDVTFNAPALPQPSISVNDVSIAEGNSGISNATFVISLSHAASSQVSVAYATADGTANAGNDYVTTSGIAIFAPGTTSVSVAVPVIGDTTVETDESFVLNLSSPVNATVADSQGVGTIVNDDATALSIGSVSVTEGDSGSLAAVFPLTLSAPSSQTITVSYATANVTATSGSDYTAASGTVTFAPGVTAQSVSIAVLGDLINEPTETFAVNLTNPVGATVSVAQGIGTIIDNDPLPTLSINNVSVTEGNTGTVNAVFTVTLSRASGQTVTASYATADVTATAGSDYNAVSGTLSFAPGVTTQTVTVPVRGDTLDEANETFTVNLTNPANATIATAQGTGTIIDDDATPSLVINNVWVTVGNSGTVNAVFTVTLSAASGRVVTVNYATANGSATSSGDYAATSGTLTFATGITSQTITVAGGEWRRLERGQ